MQCLLEPQCAPSLLPPTPCPPLRRYVSGAVTNWTLVSLNHDTQVGVGGWVGVGGGGWVLVQCGCWCGSSSACPHLSPPPHIPTPTPHPTPQMCMDPNVIESKVMVSSTGHDGPMGASGEPSASGSGASLALRAPRPRDAARSSHNTPLCTEPNPLCMYLPRPLRCACTGVKRLQRLGMIPAVPGMGALDMNSGTCSAVRVRCSMCSAVPGCAEPRSAVPAPAPGGSTQPATCPGNLPRQPAPATCPGNLPSICAVLLFTSLPAGWLTGWLDADHSTCNVSRCCCCCCCCCSRGRRGGPHSGGHPWHGNLRHGSRRAGGVPPYGPHVWRYVCVGAEGSPRGHELPAQVGFRAGGWEGGREGG